MGAWSLLLLFGLFLIFMGLFTHWILIAAGVLLPFLPLLAELLKRYQQRRGD